MLSRPELLDRIFQSSAGTFSPALAREILELHFPPADHARYQRLSAKAQRGTLTSSEQQQLDDYLNLNDFLMVLRAKAQASLQRTRPAA